MGPMTDSANTESWLDASRDMKVAPLTQFFMATVNAREQPYPDRGLYDSLVKIALPFIGAASGSLDLESWDALSDEALAGFEQGLE